MQKRFIEMLHHGRSRSDIKGQTFLSLSLVSSKGNFTELLVPSVSTRRPLSLQEESVAVPSGKRHSGLSVLKREAESRWGVKQRPAAGWGGGEKRNEQVE